MTQNRIKELRKSRNFTLENLVTKLAEKNIKSTTSQLSKYENGTRSPRKAEIWKALSEIFGVSVPYLKGDSNYKQEKEASEFYLTKNTAYGSPANASEVVEAEIVEKYGEKTLEKIKNNLPNVIFPDENGNPPIIYNEYGDLLTAMSNLNDDFFDILVLLASLDEKKRKVIISFIKDML